MGDGRSGRKPSVAAFTLNSLQGVVLVLVVVPMFGMLGFVFLIYRGLKRRSRFDGETRCRKCAHILRGLSEPRCPECGEWI
jgi:hypothetical protein